MSLLKGLLRHTDGGITSGLGLEKVRQQQLDLVLKIIILPHSSGMDDQPGRSTLQIRLQTRLILLFPDRTSCKLILEFSKIDAGHRASTGDRPLRSLLRIRGPLQIHRGRLRGPQRIYPIDRAALRLQVRDQGLVSIKVDEPLARIDTSRRLGSRIHLSRVRRLEVRMTGFVYLPLYQRRNRLHLLLPQTSTVWTTGRGIPPQAQSSLLLTILWRHLMCLRYPPQPQPSYRLIENCRCRAKGVVELICNTTCTGTVANVITASTIYVSAATEPAKAVYIGMVLVMQLCNAMSVRHHYMATLPIMSFPIGSEVTATSSQHQIVYLKRRQTSHQPSKIPQIQASDSNLACSVPTAPPSRLIATGDATFVMTANGVSATPALTEANVARMRCFPWL